MMWEKVNRVISDATGSPFNGEPEGMIAGGCINQATRLRDKRSGRCFFVKTNRAELLEMFVAEALGLKAIGETGTIRVPDPICWGGVAERSFLVLEWLDLGGSGSWSSMGEGLARLHGHEVSPQYGWVRDNYIGATPQKNELVDHWPDFFRDHRLAFQYRLALYHGGHFPRFPKLLEAIPDLLAEHKLRPALVHGDLWGGNASFTRDGEPVVFDVATYWGDREVDLAMCELFGGFPSSFFEGYKRAYPIDAGYERRRVLYNLYHILNHFNLFGGSYEHQANRMIDQLLA